MSLKLSEINGYGTGALGTPETLNPSTINSYARVSALTSTSVTINLSAAQLGSYEKFTVGTEILFHVSAATPGLTDMQYLGCYGVARITAVNSNVLTLDKDLTQILPASELSHYYCQVVTIAQFESLTLATGTTIRPYNYSATNFYGGIVAIKCSETLTFDGGHIDLSDAGIPTASKSYRPVMPLESYASSDTQKYSGWENFACKENFTLQAGDGAAFIVAKNFVCSDKSRIGNLNSYGSAFCRGASNSVGTVPANITNVGGSSIFVVAGNIENFTQKMFAKYRSNSGGQGICRCYIATNTTLPNDEGLYSFDVLGDNSRVMKNFSIKNFGNGSIGDLSNPAVQLNNYARITAISTDRKKITYTGKTTSGLAQISTGALVMIHLNHKSTGNVALSGRFILANVLSDNGTDLFLDTAIPDDFDVSKYAGQVVSVVQSNNFTLSATNSATPKFDGKIGGIFAVAVKGACNLSGGKINVESKGGGNAYGSAGLKYISNSGMNDRLPIGAGHGSVFILAKSLTMNSTTRIGATYSGSTLTSYCGASGDGKGKNGTGGSGAGAGTQSNGYNGGYGSNATNGACQGAHVMIIAETINDFNLNAISTGGAGGTGVKVYANGANGGAGYGGSGAETHHSAKPGVGGKGGYNGGGGGSKCSACTKSYGYGGGSSGWAFLYCRNAVNPNYTNVVA